MTLCVWFEGNLNLHYETEHASEKHKKFIDAEQARTSEALPANTSRDMVLLDTPQKWKRTVSRSLMGSLSMGGLCSHNKP